eukprot:4764246-Prymnesium_polylepis.1
MKASSQLSTLVATSRPAWQPCQTPSDSGKAGCSRLTAECRDDPAVRQQCTMSGRTSTWRQPVHSTFVLTVNER